MGEVRRLLEAADPYKDSPPFFHKNAIPSIVEAAVGHLDEWVRHQRPNNVISKYGVERVLPSDQNRAQVVLTLKVGGTIHVDFEYEAVPYLKGGKLPEGTRGIYVRSYAEVGWSGQRWDEAKWDENRDFTDNEVDAIDEIIKELTEEGQPTSSGDDLWWGDENYYPIRPLFAGESQDLKPIESWTVVKGSTGEVVSEASEDPYSDDKRIKLMHIFSERPVFEALYARILKWEEEWNERADARGVEYDLNVHGMESLTEIRITLHGPRSDTKSRWVLYFSSFDLSRPIVDEHLYTSRRGPKEPKQSKFELFSKEVDHEIQELAYFESSGTGVWWADRETYELIRPLFKGEKPSPSPDPTMVAYDPNTGEEVLGEASR